VVLLIQQHHARSFLLKAPLLSVYGVAPHVDSYMILSVCSFRLFPSRGVILLVLR
jgi:hypothetical protein